MSKTSTIVAVVAVVVICSICVSSHEGLSCNSCGDECTQSCGTRHFRTCCFNYLRKRTDPSVKPAAPSADTTNDLDGTTFAISTKPADRPVNAHETHLLAELNSFKDEQKARTQTFMAQLQRFFFGQISAFLYVQLLESRRFYDMLQAADGHPLRSVGVAAAGLSSPRET